MGDQIEDQMEELKLRANELAEQALAQWNEKLAQMAYLFQNEGNTLPLKWRPTGDWIADAPKAWDAAWNDNTVTVVNATHQMLKHSKEPPCYFEGTHQMLPELAKLYHYPEEHKFDGSPLSLYMATYYWIPIVAVTAYAVLLFTGRALMSCLPAANLKWPLFLWNLTLSAFSWVGVVRIVPHLFGEINKHGLYFSICTPACETYGAGAAGLWSFLFIISKFPELFDTAFIVLRKKPLMFLHWYHHITVLLYCWQSYTTQNAAGIYFIAMNFTVHAIMYGYYALRSINLWPRFIPSWTITLLQLSQMVGGIVICLLTYKYKVKDNLPCSISEVSFNTGVVMYASYFVLFLQILFSLLTGTKKTTSAAKKNQ
mmetsp:Transcript_10816/g.19101  ORF Transcript_10816/g.19101 Transcript_10816/m.19101 type:complete len:370 (-) Transcript_10816:78-1187(-)